MKQKTALTELIEWAKANAFNVEYQSGNFYVSVDFEEMKEQFDRLLAKEREQLESMYIQGREDYVLDYYPEKHARESFEQKFEKI